MPGMMKSPMMPKVSRTPATAAGRKAASDAARAKTDQMTKSPAPKPKSPGMMVQSPLRRAKGGMVKGKKC